MTSCTVNITSKGGRTQSVSCIFKLHYIATVIFLIGCCLLVSARQFFGSPIICGSISDIPQDVLNTYCWTNAIYPLQKVSFNNKSERFQYTTPGDGKRTVYRWISLILLFQAVLFYIPRFLWKLAEDGKLRAITLGLDNPNMEELKKSKKINLLMDYVSRNFNRHITYLSTYITCEILNTVNVIGQIYFTDRMLGKQFTDYGIKMVKFCQGNSKILENPMHIVFPREVACNHKSTGITGDLETSHITCELPLNTINGYLYLVIWFWFVSLFALSTVKLLYWIFVALFPKVRFHLLAKNTRLTDINIVNRVNQKCNVGDWFLLMQLAKNMQTDHFHEFIVCMAQNISGLTNPAPETNVQNGLSKPT